MTYDELKNGLKSLFSTLGAKTSDSNYGVALLDKTSGEPKGLMGMSALASVLGGLPKVTDVPTNLDTAVKQGVYILNGSCSYTHNYGVLIVFEGRSNYGIQIVWDQGYNKLYSRGRVGQQDFSDINWV